MIEPHRILLVEDSPTQALSLTAVLERAGWEVDWVESADQAVQAVLDRRPALVLTDFYLPDMRGDELCRLLRGNLDTRDLPVVILTGADSDQLELRGLESGADAYLEKSVDHPTLLSRLSALVRSGGRQASLAASALRRPQLLLLVSDHKRLEQLASAFEEDGVEIQKHQRLDHCDLEQPLEGAVVDEALLESEGLDRVRDSLGSHLPLILLVQGERRTSHWLGLGLDDVVSLSDGLALLKARVKNHLRRLRAVRENLALEAHIQEKELRAALADQLAEKNQELKESYRRLEEAQTQLVHSEKMATLGQLVAGVAHEVNNPLTFVATNLHNVVGWLAELEPAVGPHLDDRQAARWAKIRRRLQESLSGLGRVKELVLQLRTFSRLDEAERKPIDVGESIESALVLLRHQFKAKEVEIVKRFDFIQPLSCHPGPFNQLVVNLLSNALDAVARGGRVTVTTGFERGGLQLCVADNGRGIPPAEREKVFTPFYTTKPAGEGTGLGLAICRRIVEQHQGSIAVEGPEDEGARFVVWLPEVVS
ncbi:MAG: ATP-binding protein [Vulcanimicrobiota bacterium]